MIPTPTDLGEPSVGNDLNVEHDQELMIASIDPSQDVDDATLARVRAMVTAPAAITRRTMPWFTLPALRPVAALAAAAVFFTAGAFTSPFLTGPELDPASNDAATIQDGTSGQRDLGASTGIATPEVAGGMDAAKAMMPWYGNRSFLVDKLTADIDPKTATGNEVVGDAREIDDLAMVVASTFGVTGEAVKPEWGGLQIGNGTDATVYVSAYGDQIPTWSYNNPTLDPWRACWTARKDGATSVGSSSGSDATRSKAESATEPAMTSEPGGLEEPCSPVTEGKLDERAAIAKARAIFGTLTSLELAYTASSDEYGVYVSATPLLGGIATSAAYWSISLIGSEVWNASGAFAELGDQRTYEIVSAKAAIGRANDVRFSAYPTYPDGFNFDDRAKIVPAAGKGAPAAAGESNQIPWPVDIVDIVSAKLGSITIANGTSVLVVPAWELRADDKRTWLVIAVVDRELDMTKSGSTFNGLPVLAVDGPTARGASTQTSP
jgi:hypothetical protein